MYKFIQKSLAMSEYDAVHECFLYSLHDLQLDYLKNRLSKVKLYNIYLLNPCLNRGATGIFIGGAGEPL